jgi:hypothetical protein
LNTIGLDAERNLRVIPLQSQLNLQYGVPLIQRTQTPPIPITFVVKLTGWFI